MYYHRNLNVLMREQLDPHDVCLWMIQIMKSHLFLNLHECVLFISNQRYEDNLMVYQQILN